MVYAIWGAAVLMLAGALMLVLDIGSAGLWIAVIAVGIAIVAIGQGAQRRGHPRT